VGMSSRYVTASRVKDDLEEGGGEEPQQIRRKTATLPRMEWGWWWRSRLGGLLTCRVRVFGETRNNK
jgi:hypothetical protein